MNVGDLAALAGALIAVVTAIATGLRALASGRRVGAARDHAVQAMSAFRSIADGIRSAHWDQQGQDLARIDAARVAARLAADNYAELALASRPAGRWVATAFITSIVGLALSALLMLQPGSIALVVVGFVLLITSTVLGNVAVDMLERWKLSNKRVAAASRNDLIDHARAGEESRDAESATLI